MPYSLFRPAIALILVFLAIGCSQKDSVYKPVSASDSSRVIEGVPFVKQKDKFCGPAALASVMRFYGQNINQEEIADGVYTPQLEGALISDMAYYATEMGYRAETKSGDINLLISLIDEGVPTIVLVDLGKWVVSVPHYYVIYGYDKNRDTFLLHTGFQGNRETGFEELDKEWEKMNRLLLVVRK
ncbi:MAG TPA: C39 family peptidase [Thermodesulfobacteriota bacterium]|nr:C39 family peptidase [Thermodesulfobacteriota bacterium]